MKRYLPSAALLLLASGCIPASTQGVSRDQAVRQPVRQQVAIAVPPLYGPLGITPQAVKQGELGSCYFHAVIAAIANHHAALIARSIVDHGGGEYTVRLADGAENVHLQDVLYARENRFDLSDGLWVTVLLRGVAQSTMRKALLAAIASSPFAPTTKFSATQLVTGSDTFVLAYDRAVRAVLTQDGAIDRAALKAELASEAKLLGLPTYLAQQFVDFLDTEGFLATLEAEVKQNGELFGAYRAVGSGGLPGHVMMAFGLTPQTRHWTDAAAARGLMALVNSGDAMIASTSPRLSEDIVARIASRQETNWWRSSRAYTVIGYDPASDRVTLRNPWGRFPDPDGIFQLSATEFSATFLETTYSK